MSTSSQRAMIPLVVALTAALPGCELVRGIFKAGVWTGVIVVVFFLALIGGIASMFRRA